MTAHQTDLAERASKEMNSAKLMDLISELCRSLDDETERMPFSSFRPISESESKVQFL